MQYAPTEGGAKPNQRNRLKLPLTAASDASTELPRFAAGGGRAGGTAGRGGPGVGARDSGAGELCLPHLLSEGGAAPSQRNRLKLSLAAASDASAEPPTFAAGGGRADGTAGRGGSDVGA